MLPRPPAKPTPLQYYCATDAQHTTPPPTPLVYAIHHTILVITISCKGQTGARLSLDKDLDGQLFAVTIIIKITMIIIQNDSLGALNEGMAAKMFKSLTLDLCSVLPVARVVVFDLWSVCRPSPRVGFHVHTGTQPVGTGDTQITDLTLDTNLDGQLSRKEMKGLIVSPFEVTIVKKILMIMYKNIVFEP